MTAMLPVPHCPPPDWCAHDWLRRVPGGQISDHVSAPLRSALADEAEPEIMPEIMPGLRDHGDGPGPGLARLPSDRLAGHRATPALVPDDVHPPIPQELGAALAAPDRPAQDDFPDMGGHFLTATRIVGRRASQHGIRIRFDAIPANPTARKPAHRAGQALAASDPGSGPWTGSADAAIQARGLVAGYGGPPVCRGVDLDIARGGFTVIVGPNGCGKSTLLRSLCRLLVPEAGQVLLNGRDIARVPARELARQVGLLPQSAEAPPGITVTDLAARGRYPHQGFFRQWSDADSVAVARAMAATGITALADRQVDQLSGGQRQRVWVAMALAQQTPILCLDEPTTYLDIAHQVDLLELLTGLHAGGRTLVAVLHDLNQACRYATDLVVMSAGRVIAQGAPAQVMTPELMAGVFDLDCLVIPDPVTATPMVVPKGRRAGREAMASIAY